MHLLLLQVFWPMLVVATLAAVVASQALISAVFQIVAQVVTTPSLHTCMPTGCSTFVCSPAIPYVYEFL